ncbi:MAG: N-6 DNA methylase [Candidatus Omnitrophota bacterium]|nr:N-6 DNA methylase [Candidatus Omnitrophota bacterium]
MNLERKYNRDDFLAFLKSFIPEFTKDVRRVGTSGLQVTKETFYLGESAKFNLSIFELIHSSSADARVALAMDGFKVMKSSATYRALVIYRADKGEDWRLSLMTATPGVNAEGKVEQVLSNPRRFSFFLGPNAQINTPYQFLIEQGQVKDFDDLKSRFSIEVVNKNFYTQIAVLFTQLAGGKRIIGRKSIDAGRGLLNLPSTVDDTLDKEFTVRLIGRLVFCWFLKKKRSDKNIALLPEELLSVKAVSRNRDYYHGILEPLFFEVLNTSVVNREKKYQGSLWSQIPFLNGGLFTPHHHDFYELGPLRISKYINTLKVPDHWIKELFEILETYNFTIDENTSIDVELSIEPEMLGRIFENLLAEINPETGETARKATGSFYTPRPIVEHMVDESLNQYLLTKTKLDESKIKSLLSYESFEVKLTESEKESVLGALDVVKVIDPACGSGAFPMGILQKILLILQKLDPESEWWLERKLSQIESKLLRQELGRKLKSQNVNYVHKLGIIQSSIYGVDIQPIAVEISKLRFFLSLIVDEKVSDTKENRGVEPLPNLEFKFMCTNSLIGLPKKEKNSDELFEAEDTQSISELKDLRDEYLRSYGVEKEKIQIKFLKTQRKMAEFYWQSILRPQIDLWGNQKEIKKQDVPEFTRMLSNWDPFSDKPAGWFDPEWMFGIKDGFDIVIGNPPYGILNKKQNKTESIIVSEEELEFFKNSSYYEPASGGMINIFRLFILRSIYLLSKNGIFSEIFPLAFIGDLSIGRLRKYILDHYEILSIEAFPERDNSNKRVFEAVKMSVCILNLRNSKTKSDAPFFIRINTDRYIDEKAEKNYLTKKIVDLIDKENTTFPLTTLKETNLLVKIFSNSIRFSQIGKCNTGEVDMTFCKDCFSNNPNNARLLKGAIIDRYQLRTKMSQGEIVFIDEKKLFALKRNLSNDFKVQERIVLQGITGVNESSRLKMMIIKDAYCANSLNYLTLNKDLDKKYLLGIFNSKLLNFVFSKFSTNSNVNGYEIDNAPVIIDDAFIEPISKLVSFIILNNHVGIHSLGGASFFFERLIDAMVYELYLSDEIKAANCEILQYLGNLQELKDDWSDGEKLAAIEKVYKKFFDLLHPVSAAMAKMQGIPEVRIIEGRGKD